MAVGSGSFVMETKVDVYFNSQWTQTQMVILSKFNYFHERKYIYNKQLYSRVW